MNEKIAAYIEKEFKNAPTTPKALELKEELLANLNEKYTDLLACGRSEEDAYLASICGLGDIRELLGALEDGAPAAQPAPQAPGGALLTVIAIMLYIMSFIPVILASLANQSVQALAACIMFIIWGVATGLLVYKAGRKKHDKKSSRLRALAIALYITSVTPVILSSMAEAREGVHIIATCIMFVMWAAATGLLVYCSQLRRSMRTVHGDTTPPPTKKDYHSKKVFFIPLIVLPLVFLLLFGVQVVYDAAYLSTSAAEPSEYIFTAENINDVTVDWASGNISVKATDAQTLSAKESSRYALDDRRHMECYVEGGRLVIKQRLVPRFRIFSFGMHSNSQLELLLPRDVYGRIDINNISGDITAGGIGSTSASLSTISGALLVTDLNADKLELDTTSGSISGDALTAKAISSSVVSGSLSISGIFSDVRADNVSGRIHVISDKLPESFRADSVSGEIILTLPENDGFEVNFSKVSGNISSDFELYAPVPKNGLINDGGRYVYKDGGPVFSASVVSGSLRFKRAEP